MVRWYIKKDIKDMKTTAQIINYLKIHNLWDAYVRNCSDDQIDPIDVINNEGIRSISNAFTWMYTPEGVDQWHYEAVRFAKWFASDSTTPLKVIHYKGGAVTLTGMNSNPTMAGVHFASAEQAREWLDKNLEYEVDYNDLMEINTEC